MKNFLLATVMLFCITASAQHTSHWKVAPGINTGYTQTTQGIWVAGDTIVFTPGTSPRTYFTIQNVHGTAAAHIVLYASGGEIEMLNGFSFLNCTYVDIDGDHAGVQYGFRIHHINDYQGDPIDVQGTSSHQKFHGFYAYHTNDGMRIKNDLACDSSSKWPFRFTGYEIYNFKLEDFTNEGMYLGNTDSYDLSRTYNCNGTLIDYRVSGIDSFSVHDGIIKGAHRQGINFSGADGDHDNWFYNLEITQCGYPGVSNQGAGFFIGSASRNVHIYNCYIHNTYDIGIHSYCEGLFDCHNNIIDSGGYVVVNGSQYYTGGINNIEVDNFNNFTIPPTFQIQNNSLGVNTAGKNIQIDNDGRGYVGTNIICNSGTVGNPKAVKYISTCSIDTSTHDSIVYRNCDKDTLYHLSTIVTISDTIPVKDTEYVNLIGKYKKTVRWHHNVSGDIEQHDSTIYYDSPGVCKGCATCIDTIKVKNNIRTNYGVLIPNNDSITNALQKIAQAKLLNVTWMRLPYTMGNGWVNKTYKDNGMNTSVTFNSDNATIDVPKPFPTDTARVGQVVDSICAISKPDRFSFLNEPPLFWTGTCAQYINALTSFVYHAHKNSVQHVSDGGELYGIVYYMALVYHNEGKTDSLKILSQLTGVDTMNLLYSTYAVAQQTWYSYFISHIAATGIDAVNLHWYERPVVADTALTVTSKLLPLVINFIKARTGLPVITDETWIRNFSTSLLNDMLSEWKACSPVLLIGYDGNGIYVRSSSALEAEFKNFVITNP